MRGEAVCHSGFLSIDAGGNKHKSTLSDDDGGEDAEGTSCVSDLPVGKRCSGCERVTGTDKSFYVPSKPFAWLYADGRGEWRKDCGSTFGFMFKCVMSLPTFSRWILDHRAEYLGTLLAVVTLRKEGVKHLSTAVVEKRMDFLRWCYALSGYPYPMAAVHILAPSQDSLKPLAEGS